MRLIRLFNMFLFIIVNPQHLVTYSTFQFIATRNKQAQIFKKKKGKKGPLKVK